MTRSFKSPKQYAKHDFIANSPSPKFVKKNGAGKFNWGSEKEHIEAAMEEVQEERFSKGMMADAPPASVIPELSTTPPSR